MQNVMLVGYRCTGKTSVGQRIAERLGREFLDLDEWIETETGRSPGEIIVTDGEESFRDQEQEALKQVAGRKGLVLATGGGVVLREENLRRMQAHGLVLWLRAEAETIVTRMQAAGKKDRDRPPLTNLPQEQEVLAHLRRRTPLYEAAAHCRFDTDEKSIEEVADAVMAKLREERPSR